MNKTKVFYYFLFYVASSLLINLGSAFPNMMSRMTQPLFVPLWVGTLLLVMLYTQYANRLEQRMRAKRFKHGQQPHFFNMCRYILYVLVGITAVHILLLYTIAGQKLSFVHYIQRYVQHDYVFLALPFLLYGLIIYYFPSLGLVDQFWRQSNLDIMRHRGSFVQKWQQEQADKQLLEKPDSVCMDDKIMEPLQAQCETDVLFVQGINRNYCAYLANGEKILLNGNLDAVMANPWLVKINQSYRVNMYYLRVESLSPLSLEIADEQIKRLMCKNLSEAELKEILSVSKRLKVNVMDFWNNIIYIKNEDSKKRSSGYFQ